MLGKSEVNRQDFSNLYSPGSQILPSMGSLLKGIKGEWEAVLGVNAMYLHLKA